MDSLLNLASRALAAGDPLAALDRVALRDDPAALVLRGIAMAQLGELARASTLLQRAAKTFGVTEPLAAARCEVALAEVALARRQLEDSTEALDAAIDVLEAAGDTANAAHGRLVRIRRRLVRGEVKAAASDLSAVDLGAGPPRHVAMANLIAAEVCVRSLDARAGAKCLIQADAAAERAGVAALAAEVAAAQARLDAPAARRCRGDAEVSVTLFEVQTLSSTPVVLVDGCRRCVTVEGDVRSLAGRPVLFSLLARLGRAWPAAVAREELIHAVFGPAKIDDSWRARLRVEVGRLRKQLLGIASLHATSGGYQLETTPPRELVALVPPVDGPHAALVALLGDGATWSASALAVALGVSPRTMQRALAQLRDEGEVESLGKGRAQRWVLRSAVAFTTALLLPGVVSGR